jgi:hypothetical protein
VAALDIGKAELTVCVRVPVEGPGLADPSFGPGASEASLEPTYACPTTNPTAHARSASPIVTAAYAVPAPAPWMRARSRVCTATAE